MAKNNVHYFIEETRWSDLYSFPLCPEKTGCNPLTAYLQNLKVGTVFAYNDDSPKLLIYKFAITKSNSSILVMCTREGSMCEYMGFQPWLLANITCDKGIFVHSKLEAYFEKDDANEAFYVKYA